MKLFSWRNSLVGIVVSCFIVLGAANLTSAQNYTREYREWQQAQQRAQREYNQYLRTGSRSDYRDWQRAQRRAQEQYADYQRTAGMYNRNNTRYNAGYNTRYNAGYNNRVGSRYYRVYRNGSYYQTDSRGAELLRAAVNRGYQQGFQQGQMDARYRRGGNYYGNNVYQHGVTGYQSYVERSQYQYYFQQGFQRGYEDGYNNQFRYGTRSNSGLNILGTILNGILNISQY